jgi:hypothetical protein
MSKKQSASDQYSYQQSLADQLKSVYNNTYNDLHYPIKPLNPGINSPYFYDAQQSAGVQAWLPEPGKVVKYTGNPPQVYDYEVTAVTGEVYKFTATKNGTGTYYVTAAQPLGIDRSTSTLTEDTYKQLIAAEQLAKAAEAGRLARRTRFEIIEEWM